MSYQPVTRPFFLGDDWHELRDMQYEFRWDTMGAMAGRLEKLYLSAATITGLSDDPAVAFLKSHKRFDARRLGLAHARLAAFWRYSQGHLTPTLPGTVRLFDEFFDAWERWLLYEVTLWFWDNPLLIHLAIRVIVDWGSGRAPSSERALWEAMVAHYPLPQTDTADMFLPDDLWRG